MSEQGAGRAVGALGGQQRPVGPNRNITNKNGSQHETSIAVDPTDPRHIAAASNDYSGSGTFNGVYESIDGGRTWTNSNLNVDGFCYDPWLDFNANGDLYFAYQCDGQRIAYKRKGSTDWVDRLIVRPRRVPDRSMVVIDDNAGSRFFGSVYVAHDEYLNTRAHISYSADGFGGWVRSPRINDVGTTFGVNAAVAPHGILYACWLDWAAGRLYVDRSFDGGATWGRDELVHSYRIDTGLVLVFIPPQPDRGIVPMCFSDVIHTGAFAGRLLVTYTDRSPNSVDTHIYVRWTDDQGNSWSPEIKVDDDVTSAYHFHPSISVDNTGRVGISFYSTRGDPRDELTNQFIAFSTDGGATWTANVRVTTQPSNESGGDSNDYGDYQGLDATSHRRGWFHVVWTDSRPRSNAEDMWTAPVR